MYKAAKKILEFCSFSLFMLFFTCDQRIDVKNFKKFDGMGTGGMFIEGLRDGALDCWIAICITKQQFEMYQMQTQESQPNPPTNCGPSPKATSLTCFLILSHGC